jgi:hypothetical protein
MSKMSLSSIVSGPEKKPYRMVLLGVEKVGKSTFAASAPNAVVIPIAGETGIDALDCAKFPVANSYGELIDAVAVLGKEDHNFKTLVIDSASALEPLIIEKLLREYGVSSFSKVDGGYGSQFIALQQAWWGFCRVLDRLRDVKGMNIILIGHVVAKVFSAPGEESYDKYTFDINNKSANALNRWADITAFAKTEIMVIKHIEGLKEKKVGRESKKGRMLYTRSNPAYPCGSRDPYGQIPEVIPLDYKVFEDEVNKVTANWSADEDIPAESVN